MSDQSLRDAIVAVAQDALVSTHDKILRLEVSKDWPVASALRELDKAMSLRVFVQRPFRETEFKNLKTTENGGLATRWRNEKGRNYAVVILGTSTGNLDAGLKDVRPLPRKAVVEEWKNRVHKQKKFAKDDLAKFEVQHLVSELFNRVANGELLASKLEGYLNAIAVAPKVDAVCGNLWRLNLIPDGQAVDRKMAAARLSRNQELVYRLRESDDPKIESKLERAAESGVGTTRDVAKAAIEFRKAGRPDDLKDIKLPVLEEILTTAAVSQARAIDISELLDFYVDQSDSVRECLQELTSEWDLNELPTAVPWVIEIPFISEKDKEKERLLVRLMLTPLVKEQLDQENDGDGSNVLEHRWTGEDENSSILAAVSTKEAPESLSAGQTELSCAKFREQRPDGISVDSFLEARDALRKYEPWLECDAFSLLLLHEEARDAVRAYIAAWIDLADKTSQLSGQENFVETVQVLETVQGPRDEERAPSWITLGPLHPFRLDPCFRVAERVVECLKDGGGVEKLGEAANWMLDRSYPAYPTIHRNRFTLHLMSHRGLVIYSKNPGQYLPAVREANGLDRIFRALDGYSPWLLDGTSILAIDAPAGGGVVRALESARRRRKGNSLLVYHLTTGNDTDTLDGYNGEIEYLPRVDTLANQKDLPPVNTILRFAAEAADVGQMAGAQWQATKGTHLALEISDVVTGGPFAAKRTPQIKIDPRYGNFVVLKMQALFSRLSGVPMLATIRPLLQTDDAPVLSRMASGADWIIFAAPGPLGLVSPATINDTLRFVGRSSMGNYGLYVYAADDMFAVRQYFEDYFQRTPVSTIPPEQFVSKLVAKALQSGHAVLFSSLGQVSAQVAALVALEVAQAQALEDEQVFVLSLDDMGWTRAWLSEGKRADYLAAYFRKDGSVLLRIVESKSNTGEQLPCEPNQRAYKLGLEQVRASLDSLREIATAASPTLDQDLRFASLIEHLMAAILMRVDQLDSNRQFIFNTVNALSRRQTIPEFEGMVVLSQPGVNKETQVRRIDSELQIAWAGAPETYRVFGIDMSVPPIAPEEGGGAPTDETATEQISTEEPGAATENVRDMATAQVKNAEMATAFIVAARIHGIPVVEDEPVYIQEGPSLFAIGLRLKEGSTIQPLKARLTDIARDIGLGDRANEMEVENDPEPRTVRVLLPRPDRDFPELPATPKIPIGKGGYLPIYIGKTVDGTDWADAIESWPHLLVAGTTGSGKTTFVRSILKQLNAYGAGRLQVALVDGKAETDYLGLLPPELFTPKFPDVQLGSPLAVNVLKWALEEMETRRKRIMEIARQSPSPGGVKATDLYRAALKEEYKPEIVPLIIIIDEFAEIMLASKKSAEEFETLVQRISQVGRSRLIHLVLATQRPDKETIRGAIKANLDARAVFRLPTQADSMTVLGRAGAERLMLHGDMLFQHGSGNPIRLQGYIA